MVARVFILPISALNDSQYWSIRMNDLHHSKCRFFMLEEEFKRFPFLKSGSSNFEKSDVLVRKNLQVFRS
jgi:hypothetical protein